LAEFKRGAAPLSIPPFPLPPGGRVGRHPARIYSRWDTGRWDRIKVRVNKKSTRISYVIIQIARGWAMYNIKGLVIGAILLSLVLAPACSPPPPPPDIPANYTTFTEESNYFSISYPADWKASIYYKMDIMMDNMNNTNIMNSLKIKLMRRVPEIVFMSGPEMIVDGDPCLNIVVEPRVEYETLEEQNNTDCNLIASHFIDDFQGFSQVSTTIGGRKAIVVDFTGSESGELTGITLPENPRHYLMMDLLAGNTHWRVTCSSSIDDFATWRADFNNIIKSLRISDKPLEKKAPSPWG